MKRFKSAFTLPEVLLSLSIIGIIAAITIPQVYVAVKDAQNKATLGRANEQIELGMQNIIQDYNLKHPGAPAIMTLSEAFADLDDEEKFKLIALHLGLAYDKDSHIASILNSMLMPAAYAGWFNLNVYDAPDNGAPDNTVDSLTLKEHCTMHPDDYTVCGGGGGGSSSSDLNAPDQDKDAGDGDVVKEICDNGATPEYNYKTGEYTCPETPDQLPKPLCAEDEILKYDPTTGLYTCTKPIPNPIPVIPPDPNPIPPPNPDPGTCPDGSKPIYNISTGEYICPKVMPICEEDEKLLKLPSGEYVCVKQVDPILPPDPEPDPPEPDPEPTPDPDPEPNKCAEGFELICYNEYSTSCQCYAKCGAGTVRDYYENGVPYCRKLDTDTKPEDPPTPPEPDPVPVGTIKSFKLNKTSATVHFMEQINKEAVAPKDKISSIIIDTNGKAKPNTVGKDQFKYVLLNNGKLVPQEE